MTTPRRRSDRQLAAALLAAVYVAGVGAVLFAPDGSPVATWWPAAGAAVALILLTPRAWWPGLGVAIAVVSAAANLTGGRDLELSVMFGIANAAEALVAGAFLRRTGHDRPRLESQDDFISLVEAALLGGVTIATCASLSVVALGQGSFLDSWTSVFASHAAATLVLVPVALSWHQRLAVRKPWELALQSTLLAGVTFAVFSPQQTLSLTFVPLPFLVWAALRFSVRTVTWQLAAFSVLTTFQTANGYGPIGGSY